MPSFQSSKDNLLVHPWYAWSHSCNTNKHERHEPRSLNRNQAWCMGRAEVAEPLPKWVVLPVNDVAVKIRRGQGNTAFFQDLTALLAAVQHVAESSSAVPFLTTPIARSTVLGVRSV